ncbi:hypothetical protein CHS0354_021222 [Potamilus streckersoni]|uniref:PH domain-containing protein n=1 Tax=Potamilus streckersoni TaxID=2493646 RepID=A0AAE0SSB4_9BIVA|nr:hypothetical protein CHS0354_021222 [Potamilus streckersoni]
MRRRAKMNRQDHVVYSGWMIKSPPEKKLTGPWKIFRAKWKRRFFVLSKPSGSLPGEYLLNYYSDENCKRPKGSIDLEQCLEIIESLDSDQFQYLLAIKTTFKSKERTYFLATETEEQMSTWVRNLCSVCGMKPDEANDQGTPQPPQRDEVAKKSPSFVTNRPPISVKETRSLHHTPQPSPIVTVTAQPKQQVVQPSTEASIRAMEYIPISECVSGKPLAPDPQTKVTVVGRQNSIDSVPEERAPPPPLKMNHTINEVFAPFDTRSSSTDADSIYKVPPLRGRPFVVDSTLDPYDVPPARHSPGSPRSSSSGESQKVDSAYASHSGLYDVPPSQGPTQDDLYSFPSSIPVSQDTTVPPPARPPKPIHLTSTVPIQEPYENLPPNSKAFPVVDKSVDVNAIVPPKSCFISDPYDIPKSAIEVSDTSVFASPPAPHTTSIREHKYINAASGVLQEDMDKVYLPMARAFKKAHGEPHEVEYADMSGKDSPENSFSDMPLKNSIYDHPPPTRPAKNFPPPRPQKPASPGKPGDKDIYSIFSTARTRSFKKSSSSSNTPIVTRRGNNIPLPQRHPDFSSSSEDEDDVLVDTAQNLWKATPPAPQNKDTELKYLDLALDDSPDEPMRSPHVPTGQSSPTEYREIDFVKTQALSEVKKMNWRVNEDH